ncbi:hypothetical protein LJR234_003655 [Mesorhizobium amorphae]|uniref:hypothetical protein n=1 Tax=Mesorhizobium amorphae TaxID=71433 RepID=UPI003ECD8ED0
MKIAVLYLARKSGDHIARFAASYKQFPAGADHELIILHKGEGASWFAGGQPLSHYRHRPIVVPESIGQDIHAYKYAAQRIDADLILCLNTYAEIKAEDWLAKMVSHITRPGVAVVGAMGSHESFRDSYKLSVKVAWVLGKRPRFNARIAREFRFIAIGQSAGWLTAGDSRMNKARRFIADFYQRRPRLQAVADDFERYWDEAVPKTSWLYRFPSFPNPHIRTNAFLTSRETLLATPLDGDSDREACLLFESGERGLSRFATGRLMVINSTGKAFEADRWVESQTFRLGSQSGLLVGDNKTDYWNTFDEHERITVSGTTWGVGHPRRFPTFP